jgi:hypothetical protein
LSATREKVSDGLLARFPEGDKPMPEQSLTFTEEIALSALIEKSITERYSGDLERHEDPRGKCANTYTALDTDHIRQLLTSLWGEHITADTLESVFETLTEGGAEKEKWSPQAWCEEDDEIERQEQLSTIDCEAAAVEDQISKLTRRLKRLHAKAQTLHDEGFDAWYAENYRPD